MENIVEMGPDAPVDNKQPAMPQIGVWEPTTPAEEVEMLLEEAMDTTELSNLEKCVVKLKRFCYLGSFEPVFMHITKFVNVSKYLPIVDDLIKDMDNFTFLRLMLHVLREATTIFRRHEAIFVYAVYLAHNIDNASLTKEELEQRISWRKSALIAFKLLISADDDFFLFCKYSILIRDNRSLKWYSRTVRKAITEWYKAKAESKQLHDLWMSHRGLYGLTHKYLIKTIHINDCAIGSHGMLTPFFLTCAELLKEDELKAESITDASKKTTKFTPSKTSDNAASKANENEQTEKPSTSKRAASNTKKNKPADKAATSNKASSPEQQLIKAIAKLRTTKKKYDALDIIRKFKLTYPQVPGQFLRYAPIMFHLLPEMSYLQVLKHWRKMVYFKHFDSNIKFWKKIQKKLVNQELAQQSRLYPVNLLLNLHNIAKCSIYELSPENRDLLKMNYLENIYEQSFEWSAPPGKLRMHITLNLQRNYLNKVLKYQNGLKYIDACIALALSYCKREAHADVFYWYKEEKNLRRIPLNRNGNANDAFDVFRLIENPGKYQRLVFPLTNALNCEQVYDVFLCIVPTSGRGNPGHKSDQIRNALEKYRLKKNPKARFIILNLLKCKPSLKYSNEILTENILEICGLDKYTIDIIQNFADYSFD